MKKLFFTTLIISGLSITAGHAAAAEGSASGARPTAVSLFTAIAAGNVELTKALIEAGANIHATIYNNDRTPLHAATKDGNADIVNVLLRAFARERAMIAEETMPPSTITEAYQGVNARDDFQQTALHIAAYDGHTAIVQDLLNARAQTEVYDSTYKSTPLHHAAIQGHSHIVQLLLNARANTKAVNQFGETALQLAVKHDHFDVARRLVIAGAEVTVLNPAHLQKLVVHLARASDLDAGTGGCGKL